MQVHVSGGSILSAAWPRFFQCSSFLSLQPLRRSDAQTRQKCLLRIDVCWRFLREINFEISPFLTRSESLQSLIFWNLSEHIRLTRLNFSIATLRGFLALVVSQMAEDFGSTATTGLSFPCLQRIPKGPRESILDRILFYLIGNLYSYKDAQNDFPNTTKALSNLPPQTRKQIMRIMLVNSYFRDAVHRRLNLHCRLLNLPAELFQMVLDQLDLPFQAKLIPFEKRASLSVESFVSAPPPLEQGNELDRVRRIGQMVPN